MNETGGFDCIEAAVYGQWDPRQFEKLAAAIEARRQLEPEKSKARVLEMAFGDEVLYVRRSSHTAGKGKGSGQGLVYRYGLQVQGATIWIMNRWRHSEMIPTVLVECPGSTCMALTGRGAAELVCGLLARLGFEIVRAVPSRVDMCVDLPGVSTHDLVALIEREDLAVTRARQFIARRSGREFTGVYVGAEKSPIRCRIYDKVGELLGPGRDGKNAEKAAYMIANRWGGECPGRATRVEFQLRRKALKEMGVNSLELLFSKAAEMWEYLTTEWLRIVEPFDREGRHSDTAEVHPLWELVMEAGHRVGWLTHEAVERVRRRASGARKTLKRQALGCISTFLAKLGRFREVEPERWGEEAVRLVRGWLEDANELRRFLEAGDLKRAEAEAMRFVVCGFGAEPPPAADGIPF